MGRWHGDIAAELAMHFVQGRDVQRAGQYLRLAGENAMWRSAHQERPAISPPRWSCLTTLPETLSGLSRSSRRGSRLGWP